MFKSYDFQHTKLLLVMIWIFPLLLLLAPNLSWCRGDCSNYMIQSSFLAQSIRDGVYIPIFTDFQNRLAGDPTLVYAGRFYYLSLGYLSAVLGPSIALRFFVFLITFIQVISTFICAYTYGGHHKHYALYVTALSVFSTYAMNNLYVRGAMAEYHATSLLTSSVAFFLLFWHPSVKEKTVYAASGALAYAGAALMHPITAVNGAFLLLVLNGSLMALFGVNRSLIKRIFFILISITVLLSAWLYLIIFYPPILSIQSELLRFRGLDEFWVRILPFPLSFKSDDLVFVTQINMPLIGALVCILLKDIKGGIHRFHIASFIMLGCACGVLSLLSIPKMDIFLPRPLLAAQFAYRFVTYINLFTFVALIFSGASSAQKNVHPKMVYSSLWLSLASTGVVINLIQMGMIMAFRPIPRVEDVPIQGCYYTTHMSTSEISSHKTWPCEITNANLHFSYENMEQILPPSQKNEWRTTNIVYHPWSQIFMNAQPAQTLPACYFYNSALLPNMGCFYKVWVPKEGGKITYKTKADNIYVWLDYTSFFLFLALSLYLTYKFSKRIRFAASLKVETS